MQFVKPIPFEEAIDKLGRKSIIGSALSSSEWADVPVQLRERAFFSSRVESARVLQRGRDSIADYLQANRETLPNGEVALKTGSRQGFVDQMQKFLATEGIDRTDGSVRDITSERRIGLVFDVQTQSAQDFGYRKQGLDPDVLNAFPAQRFIRVKDVKDPRDYHTQFEDQVYLKSDPIWKRINADFGVPWGPWGWGCGHDVEDEDREQTEELGLLGPNDVVQPPKEDFNDNLGASIAGLDPDLVEKLKNDFGDQIVIEGDMMRWAGEVRRRQFAPPVSLNPPPQGTLDDALKAAGMDKPEQVTEAHVRKLIEELKEANPLSASQVINSMAGGSIQERLAFESTVGDFLQFVPPDRARSLHKLNLAVRSVSGENGHYSPGVGVTIGAHLTGVERTRVIFHELGHWLHLNGPENYKAAIRDHYRARTKGERTATLPGYSRGTRGKRDKWYEPYAGRIYGSALDSKMGDGLEVPTRYLELLTEPARLARLWKDETFRETMKIVLTIFY